MNAEKDFERGSIEFKRVDLGDGVVFEGEIENGKKFIFGKYFDGPVSYIGEFNAKSEMEGMGKLTMEAKGTKIVHIGMFKGNGSNGVPLLNGYGASYITRNGITQHCHGEFVNDEQHGHGTMYYEDGAKYEGEFAHGKLHGKGIITKPDGTSFSVEYDNGKPVSLYGS